MKKIVLMTLLFLAITGIAFGDSWTQKSDFGGTGRFGAASFSIGSKGYIGGGSDGYHPAYHFVKDYWSWDQATNAWTQIADFPGTPSYGPSVFVIGTNAYVGMGWDYITPYTNDFYMYNSLTNAWTQKGNFPIGLDGGVGFSINNMGYVATGMTTGNVMLKTLWQYDPTLDTWTQKADFGGTARCAAVGFVSMQKGYVGTGKDQFPSSVCRNDIWEYNPMNDTWTQKANVPGNLRCDAAGFAIGKKGYIGTGSNDVNYFSDFFEYDVVLDTWTQRATYGVTIGVLSRVGFTIGNYGYIGTGYTSAGFTQQFWEYSQTSEHSSSGINELSNGFNDLSVSIQPTTNHLFINYSAKNNATVKLRIYDLSGKAILQENQIQKVGKNEYTIDLSGVAKGIYFVELLTTDSRTSRKVVL